MRHLIALCSRRTEINRTSGSAVGPTCGAIPLLRSFNAALHGRI